MNLEIHLYRRNWTIWRI